MRLDSVVLRFDADGRPHVEIGNVYGVVAYPTSATRPVQSAAISFDDSGRAVDVLVRYEGDWFEHLPLRAIVIEQRKDDEHDDTQQR